LTARLFLGGAVSRDPFFLVIRIHRAGDVGRLHLARGPTAAITSSIEARAPAAAARPFNLSSAYSIFAADEQPLHDPAAKGRHIDRARPCAFARRIAARALPVTASDFPGRWRRRLGFRGQDLDLVAVLQLGRQRRRTCR